MSKFAAFAIAAFLLLIGPLAGWAQQTLVLRDGTRYSGILVRADQNSLTFRDDRGQPHDFDIGQVQSLQFDGSARPGNRARSGSSSRGTSGNSADAYRMESSRPDYGGNRSGYLTLPAGTQIAVRTNETINAQNSSEGRTYRAQLDQDVSDGTGNVLIPRGAEAELAVRGSGNNELVLDLQSVLVNGQRYTVDSQAITQQGEGREGVGANRRTAEYVGGGTVLGTLLGAVTGGGKGAAIGALAGAAAGAGTQVLTKGAQVRVPAETVLNFRLDHPITLNPGR